MAENGAAGAPKVELLEDDGEEEFVADQGAGFVAGASSSDGLSVTSSEHVPDERGGDSTECSSSFADSFCESGDEADYGDLEVNSSFSVHADGTQASALARKKKVTADWRNAVRPMLWRCEWLELRMKDLLSQVSKYDSQLALIKQEKELQRAISKTNGSRTESGKSYRGHKNISMERRKRKRHEDTVDTSMYLKKHQILSYFFDKQNKGAETGGVLVDDDSHGPVGDDTKGLLDIVGLPASKEYDMVSKQFMLQKVLLKIGGIQSRIHRLQERLSKACSRQAKLASFMDHAQVEVPEKRQRTQKRSFSPTHDRYAKPQKKRKLNILLEQEDRLTLSVKPTLSERTADCVKEEPQGSSEEKAAEKGQAHKTAITLDLLLGVESSLPNGYLGDLCKENSDDILIDNQGANEGCQPFATVKHPPETPPVLTENIAKTAPPKAGNTSSEPAEAEKIPVTLVKQEQILEKRPALTLVYTGKKWRRQPQPEDPGSAAATSKNHSREASEIPAAANQKAQATTPTEAENTGSMKQKTMDTRSSARKLNSCSAAKTPETRNSSSAATRTPKTGNSSSGAKTSVIVNISSDGNNKRVAGNSSAAAKKPKMGNPSSDGKKHTAGNSSAAVKKPRTGNSSQDGKKQAAGNPSASVAGRKEMSGNIPVNMRIEKAILVEVNSRRSQRVRKPKVY